MNTGSISWVIFDYDGTIASIPIEWAACRPLAKERLHALCGIPLFADRALRVDQMEWETIQYLRRLDRAQDIPRVFDFRREVEGSANCVHRVNLTAEKQIREMSDQGILLMICSNNLHSTVRSGLEELGILKCFGDIVCIDDCLEPKPSPLGIQMLVDRNDLSAGDGIVIGDNEGTDGCAATAAGIRYIDINEITHIDTLL